MEPTPRRLHELLDRALRNAPDPTLQAFVELVGIYNLPDTVAPPGAGEIHTALGDLCAWMLVARRQYLAQLDRDLAEGRVEGGFGGWRPDPDRWGGDDTR